MDNTTEKVVEYSRIFDRLLTSTRISTREVLLDLKFIFDFLGQGNGRNTPTNNMSGMGPRRNSTMELFQEGQDADIEYFFASDASAIIEHTNRVIYLEVKKMY